MEIGNIQADELVVRLKFRNAFVSIKYIDSMELKSILSKSQKTEWKKHKLVTIEDDPEANRLLGRAAVKEWENITANGQPFPYSPENCDLMMRNSYEFSAFVNDACTEMANFRENQDEETKKKSENTPTG